MKYIIPIFLAPYLSNKVGFFFYLKGVVWKLRRFSQNQAWDSPLRNLENKMHQDVAIGAFADQSRPFLCTLRLSKDDSKYLAVFCFGSNCVKFFNFLSLKAAEPGGMVRRPNNQLGMILLGCPRNFLIVPLASIVSFSHIAVRWQHGARGKASTCHLQFLTSSLEHFSRVSTTAHRWNYTLGSAVSWSLGHMY